MKKNRNIQLLSFILFFLMLIGYRYSLLHDVSQLTYLRAPETVAPFTMIVTYFFMCIGILPTILLILFTSVLCQTAYPSGVVLYTCFGKPFAMGESTGFNAYIIACVLSALAVYLISSAFMHSQKSHE